MGVDADIYFARMNENGELVSNCMINIQRNYALFGWIADIRNFAGIPNITEVGKYDVPLSASLLEETHGCYIAVVPTSIILETDYDEPIENRRTSVSIGNVTYGGMTVPPGHGIMTTLRELLNPDWFEAVESITDKDEYLVFAFDQF